MSDHLGNDKVRDCRRVGRRQLQRSKPDPDQGGGLKKFPEELSNLTPEGWVSQLRRRGMNDCESWGDSAWCIKELNFRTAEEQSEEGAGAKEETLEGAASWTALEAVIELHPKVSGKQGSDMVRFPCWKMTPYIVEMTWRRKRLAARRPGWGMVRDSESLDSCFICWNGVKITDAHRAMMSWEDRVWTSCSTLLLSGEGNGYSLQYSCLEKSHGQRSLAGYSPCSHKSWTQLSNYTTPSPHSHMVILQYTEVFPAGCHTTHCYIHACIQSANINHLLYSRYCPRW